MNRIFRYSIRQYSTKIKSYFELFPKSFPSGGPPKDPFTIHSKNLRREFRVLQSEHHPDILIGTSQEEANFSSILNKAYTNLQNPYSRISHVIELNHPDNLDISQDDTSKKIIEQIQNQSEQSLLEYKNMLMTVLEAHEHLEFAESEEDLDPLSEENNERIQETEEIIDDLLKQEPINWDKVLIEAIRLKYWVNIESGIRDWEPGKPVNLTH